MAVNFDAADSALRCSNGFHMGSGDLTVCLWAKNASSAFPDHIISTRPSGSGDTGWKFLYGKGPGKHELVAQQNRSGGMWRAVGNNLNDAAWHWCCLTFDQGGTPTITLYQNDPVTSVDSAAASGTPLAGSELNIGNEADASSTRNFHGDIAEVGIWVGRLLNAAERAAAKRGGRSLMRLKPDFYDPLIDNTALGYADWSNNHRSVTKDAAAIATAEHPQTLLWTPRRTIFIPAVTVTTDQEGYRVRNDDGSEAAATWKAAQDTKANVTKNQNFRLRGIVNTTGNLGSKQVKIRYKQTGDADAELRDVPVE